MSLQIKQITQNITNKNSYISKYDAIRDFLWYVSRRFIVIVYQFTKGVEAVFIAIAGIIAFVIKYFWSVLFVVLFFILGFFIGANKTTKQICNTNDAGCGVIEYANKLKQEFKINQ